MAYRARAGATSTPRSSCMVDTYYDEDNVRYKDNAPAPSRDRHNRRPRALQPHRAGRSALCQPRARQGRCAGPGAARLSGARQLSARPKWWTFVDDIKDIGFKYATTLRRQHRGVGHHRARRQDRHSGRGRSAGAGDRAPVSPRSDDRGRARDARHRDLAGRTRPGGGGGQEASWTRTAT